MSSRSQKTYAKAGAVASEVIHAMPTVSQFNAQGREHKRYAKLIDDARVVGEKKALLTSSGMAYTQGLMFITYGIALWYGAKLIADGVVNSATGSRYTGGDVISVFFSVLMGAFALGQAAPNFPAITNGKAAAYRIFKIIDNQDDGDDDEAEVGEKNLEVGDGGKKGVETALVKASGKEELAGGEKLEHVDGNISVENISFSYPARPEVQIFNGLTFHVKKGETVALVGESGSGKSTIVGLIERFYEPTAGKILLDGHNIQNLDLHWMRKQIGLVSQQPLLFTGTIAENIRVGNPEASDAEVESAAKLANAHDFIKKLPNGYQTMLTGSSQLSGGQKQRIAIARAVIKNPKVLLLDEATSALDNKSEAVVQKALDEVMKHHTTIVIAHRLSTVRNADKICVFQKGQLIEQGKHEELMVLGGLYRTLVEAQSLNAAHDEKHDEKGDPDEVVISETQEAKATDAAPERRKSFSKSKSKNAWVKLDEADEDDVGDRDKYDPEKDKAKKDAPNVSPSRALDFVTDHFVLLAIGVLFSMLLGVVFPGFSFVFSEMITVFYLPDYDEMRKKSLIWMGGFFAIAAGIAIFSMVAGVVYGKVGEVLTFRLRNQLFDHLLKQEIAWFDLPENSPGILSTRLATDAEQVRALVVDRVNIVIQSIFMVVIGLCLGFYYGWQLALVVLGVAPLIAVAGAAQMKFMAMGAKNAKEAFERANSLASEAISQIRTVKSFTREVAVVANYGKALELPNAQEVKTAWISGIGPGFSNLTIFGVYGLVFYIGAVFASKGWIEFGGILKVFFAIVMSFMGAGQITQFAPDTGKANLALNAIFALLERKSQMDGTDTTTGETAPVANQDIVLKDVRFRYPARPEVEVFKGVNLHVPAGRTVALVGPSGSGKSTIVQILQRFYEYHEGSIYIGSTELRNFNLKHLRSMVGVVSQEPVLFDGTIRDNVLYGNPEASDFQLQQALDQANVTPFLNNLEYADEDGKLHKGLDTVIGGKGIQLSGGQKQRVAIARAILKDPKILLLDEATSALDNESEKIVQEALEKLMEGRTTIVIAHRLSTIRNADKIVVMEGGRVVEEGTHDELASREDGVYAGLVRAGQKN
eukprot:TRINITY_DN2894_c0_g1_i1.p1 TRINITY_DN2894_c0_g1~~TRINITY_DN2894_c0_g1_i1.p1  ORF type:complete len:1165 (+),score=378.73 TRINITY_DN2894_c0_g1_i1:197-3496(+)